MNREFYYDQLTRTLGSGSGSDYQYTGIRCTPKCKRFIHYETQHSPDCPKYKGSHSEKFDSLTTTLSLIRPLAFADHSSVEYNMEEIRKILNNVK